MAGSKYQRLDLVSSRKTGYFPKKTRMLNATIAIISTLMILTISKLFYFHDMKYIDMAFIMITFFAGVVFMYVPCLFFKVHNPYVWPHYYLYTIPVWMVAYFLMATIYPNGIIIYLLISLGMTFLFCYQYSSKINYFVWRCNGSQILDETLQPEIRFCNYLIHHRFLYEY